MKYKCNKWKIDCQHNYSYDEWLTLLNLDSLQCRRTGLTSLCDTRSYLVLCVSTGIYLRNEGTYRQTEKKLVKQQYVLHMSPQYGELQPTNG